MRLVGGSCVLALLLAAACSVESGSRPDSGPVAGEDGGGPGPDAPVAGAAGLTLQFRGVPPLPANLDGAFEPRLDWVRIDLENVRAIGDSAPGDERTTRDELSLAWSAGDGDDDEPENDPVVVSFDQAPPGLYSHVLVQLTHYQLEGTVDIEDNDRDFDIDDTPSSPLAISIALGGVTLEAGETRQLTIDVACGAAVVDTPWDQVEPEDGDLEVGSSSPHIGGIRARMESAFSYAGSGGGGGGGAE